jgi:hypothetical protein
MRRFFLGLIALAVVISAIAVFAEDSRKGAGGIASYPVQPMGHYSGGSVTWTSSVWATKGYDGVTRRAVGFDVKSSSTGGNLVVHMIDDYTASGAVQKCTLLIPASNGNTQRVGLVFDRIDSAGTTITMSDVTIWF